MSTIDEREHLINDICNYLITIVTDISDTKAALYIMMNKYEITSRCTAVAELKENKNKELLNRFLIAKTVKGCTPRTLSYYQMSVSKILQMIGKTVDDITADDIRYYMAIRQRRDHVSNVTIGSEIRCLGSFFQWLHAEEYIQRNPMLRIDRIKVKKSDKKAFTDMEVEKLRTTATDEREKAIIEILLSTGCRVTELVNIKTSEIEEDKVLVHGKGQKDRYVYLTARAMLAISIYLNKRKDDNPYLFPKGNPVKEASDKRHERKTKGWWMNPDNVAEGHMTQSSVENITRKLARRAGVERANPHKFRRTCATAALRRGMPIEQVSKMLGHEEISTTQIYLDLSEQDLAMAHRKYVI